MDVEGSDAQSQLFRFPTEFLRFPTYARYTLAGNPPATIFVMENNSYGTL